MIKKNQFNTGLILLAAGPSTRMGQPKQQLVLKGETLLRRSVKTALKSHCSPIVVVLGANLKRNSEILQDLPVEVIENPQWKSGIGSSIKAGINRILKKRIDSAVIMVCDQPFLTSFYINSLIYTHIETEKPIVASEYGSTFGTPALFSRSMFKALKSIDDEDGAKKIIVENQTKLVTVPFAMGHVDLDTPEDFARLQSTF